MNETLIVTKPYCWMEPGDTFKLSEDGNSYINIHTHEYTNTDRDMDITSKSETTCSISKEIATSLLNMGILKEDGTEARFVNVFDRIDEMIHTYNEDLINIDKDTEDFPQCMKVEKETVLRNLIKVLSYLKTLKK